MSKHPLKGRKQSPETIAKRQATLAAKREAKSNGANPRDAAIYLRNALTKWPSNDKNGIAKLYVQLAVATLEGKA